MRNFADLIHQAQRAEGDSMLYLTCSAAGAWTDQNGKSVGTSATSGIYKMSAPGYIVAISAAADGTAIIYLPPAAQFPLAMVGFLAPTGATGGDISIFTEETGAEFTTNGDMDADADLLVLVSVGTSWQEIYDGVA